MPLFFFISLLVCSAAGAGCFVYWFVVVVHIARTVRTIPTAADALSWPQASEPDGSRVCVIVPAHNERDSAPALARSLKEQDHPHAQFVFCLDRCTDDTEERLKEAIGDDARFEVLNVRSCPHDWAGKVHAIWRGVCDSDAAAESEVLLFADADTVFSPGCIRAALTLMKCRDLQMLSLLSTLTTREWFERLVQPAATMELLRQYPVLRANAQARRRAFANGQFMMFERYAYETIGGHRAARQALLEDIELARLAHRHEIRAGLFLADGVLTCRMYENWAAFRKGWKRIFTEAANRRPSRLMRARRRLALVGLGLPTLSLVAVVLGAAIWASYEEPLGLAGVCAGIGGYAAWFIATAWIYKMSHLSPWLALTYPMGGLHVMSLLREAAIDLKQGRPTEWGGRQYVRETR